MKMSDRGRKLLTEREGVRLKAYQDTEGVWTIGVGHTAAAGGLVPGPGVTITAQQADEMLSRDLVKYEKLVNDAVTVPLAQNEFDALVSVTFNVEAFARNPSTAIKRLNAGDRKGAADAIILWNRPREIVGRRLSEQKQFLTPYGAQPVSTPAAPKPAQPQASPAPKSDPQPRSWLDVLVSIFKRT